MPVQAELQPTESDLEGSRSPSDTFQQPRPPADEGGETDDFAPQPLADFNPDSLIDSDNNQTFPGQSAPESNQFARNEPTMSAPRSPVRLTRAPSMFGDFFSGGNMVMDTGTSFIDADLPLAGGSRRVKIGENNHVLPMDRMVLAHNHFHNALTLFRADGISPNVVEGANIDRFTFALEKTLGAKNASIEIRSHLTSDYDIGFSDLNVEGGSAGNLALILKLLLWRNDTAAISAGLGLELPTGSDVDGTLPVLASSFRIDNNAVHILPYCLLSAGAGLI